MPSRLSSITLYLHALAVPERRGAGDPEVIRGAELFERSGCGTCHVRTLATGPEAPVAVGREVTFHPYTDLLLHDMGEGLADPRGEFEADGREWRTAPLWGLGLLEAVNGNAHLLHDGRARDVTEAVLWHGGEARAARDAFEALSRSERDALVRFVRSL